MDIAKTRAFMQKFVNGASMSAALILLGDELDSTKPWPMEKPSLQLSSRASRAQEVGAALGAQVGEKRIRDVVRSGGDSVALHKLRSLSCMKRGPDVI